VGNPRFEISADERRLAVQNAVSFLYLLRLFAANLPGSAFRVFRVFRGQSAVRNERRCAEMSGSLFLSFSLNAPQT